MSVDLNSISNEKDENLSSQHFLSQLKDIILTSNEDISKNKPINNENIENENNSEKKENIINIDSKEIIDKKEERKNEENNDINIEEKRQTDNLIDIIKEKINKNNNINNEKKEVVNSINGDLEKVEKNVEKNDIQEKDNTYQKENKNDNLTENKEENINKSNTNNDILNKVIRNEKCDVIDNNQVNEEKKNKEENEERKNNVENEEDLIRKESKESQKSNKSQKGEKHKLCPTCLNNCFKWELKAEIRGKRPFPKNFKSKYTFPGKSVFFKKLDFSILNTLHNSLNMTKYNSSTNNLQYINTHDILEHIKSESINKLNNITSNKIPSSPLKDNTTSSIRELLNINYPIDNTKFNYSIIDANLCIKDNLKNLFLLEFDLDQIEEMVEDLNIENKEDNKENKDNKENSKEDLNKSQNNKDLRAIDDYCVEREIYFVVNGTFHGNKIFKNDLNFSVEYREFIKSCQFRLQNYQNKIIEMSKKIKAKKNLFQNMQSSFFGKVLTNINLGIEFSKPQNHEIMQTNFNSIVNSHIQINKILIELTIPNTFINNNKLNISNIFEGGNEDSILTKKTSISTPKKEEENNNNICLNNKNNNFKTKNNYDNYNIMFNSNMTSPNTRTIGINRSIPASPHLNDFQKLIYQQKYSPLINNNLRNNHINIANNFQNQAQNSFFSSTPNYPRSPVPNLNPQQMFCSPQPNTYSPLSASLMMMQMPYMGRMMQQQPMSINSPFNMSNYSSPYLGNGNRNNNSGLNSSNQQRKCSDCFQEKIILDNPMNIIGRKVYNSNHQTPIMLKRNEEEPISRINLNQYMSPKSMGPTSSFSLGNTMNSTSFNLSNPKFNGTIYQLNPMNNINQMNQMGNINQMGPGISMTIRQKIIENEKKEELERINKTLNSMNRVRPTNNNNMTNINNMPNINNINNFNNCNANNNIRNNNNMMKNNNLNNMNNVSNLNNFNNINNMKNIPNMPNIHKIPNIPNIPNISNIPNMNMMNSINKKNNYNNNLKNENEEIKEKQRMKNMFMFENQNKTNLDIFLKSVTPIYAKDLEINFLKLRIKEFFNNLKKISLHGLKNTYYSYGELVYIWYSLSLSSLSIKVTNKQLISQIFEEIKKKRKKSDTLVLKEKEEISFIEPLYNLYFTTEYMEIFFSETKPVHFRKSYFSLINSIMSSIPLFDKIMVEDIDLNESYFAILYSSFKSSKPHGNHSSFVVYYHFTKEALQDNKNGNNINTNMNINNEKYFKQTIVGILPIKLNTDFFLQRISFNSYMIYKPIPIPPYGYFNLDTLLLRNMVCSITNEVTKIARAHSYDYELFMKFNKHNYN